MVVCGLRFSSGSSLSAKGDPVERQPVRRAADSSGSPTSLFAASRASRTHAATVAFDAPTSQAARRQDMPPAISSSARARASAPKRRPSFGRAGACARAGVGQTTSARRSRRSSGGRSRTIASAARYRTSRSSTGRGGTQPLAEPNHGLVRPALLYPQPVRRRQPLDDAWMRSAICSTPPATTAHSSP
jgi:hypothetical protein